MLLRTLTALCLLLVAAAPAGAQLAGAAGGTGRATGAGSPMLTAQELESHVGFLAADALAGRRAGTPGAERAARYIVRAFQESGLAAPARFPSYLQTFAFPVGVELGPDNRLVLQYGSRLGTIFEAGRDFLPLAGSLADRIEQPVVFVGYGISAPPIGYDDYAGLDVRGKVVLALRFSPEGDSPGGRFGRYLSERYKAATAQAKGARAILFVNGPATEEIDRLIPFALDAAPADLGIVALSVTQAVARRIAATAGGDLSVWQAAINRTGRPQSRAIRGAVLNLRADLRPRLRTTHNVIGMLPGRDPRLAAEALVIGAHYDGLGLGGPGSLDPVPGEIHNGADDNASGVAGLLELAQFFAYPTNRPDRTLIFVAFGAEEEGMLGSARFVADPAVPLASLVAMLNLDMIGRLDDEVIVYGVGSSTAWPEQLAVANAELKLPLRTMEEGYGPSDHAAFYLRQVPVLAFFTGVHADYHRATDDAERLNLDGALQVTGLVRRVASQVANAVPRPAFDPRETAPRELAETPPPVATVPVRLGAVPAPTGADARGGIVIERVVEGSPAAAAGLLPGDRVMFIAGQTIDTVYAYVEALATLVPGRPVTLGVRRGEAPIELVVSP
ncbi:MAG: M28 family peptidase [Gemmatimonadota bacterium]